MTPLIDAVFLLLTFFVFAMVLMVRAEVLDIRLPRLTAGEAPRPGAAITISLARDGSISINGQPVAMSDVPSRIGELRQTSPDARLLVAVDQAGDRRALLQLWDVLAGAGLGEFSLIGRPGDRDVEPPHPVGDD